MSKVYLVTSETGCIRRKLDLKRIMRYLKSNKNSIVTKPSEADKIILATCGVTKKYSENAFKLIKKLEKFDAKLIVYGCLPEIHPEYFRDKKSIKTLTVRNINNIENYFKPINRKFEGNSDEAINEICLPSANSRKYIELLKRTKEVLSNLVPLSRKKIKSLSNKNKKGYIIQVTRGCTGNCSFCASKFAIGNLKSKPVHKCISEFKKGLEKGYKKFRLASSDLGGYGEDINESLPNLINKLIENSEKKNFRFFLPNLSPKWIVRHDKKLRKIIETGKIGGMTIALQSGSSKILERMNRYSKVEKIKKSLKIISNTNQETDIYLHIMIGFPGETREDFKETIKLLKELNADYIFTNIFSKRSGTEAEKMKGSVNKHKVKRRLKMLKSELEEVVFL